MPTVFISHSSKDRRFVEDELVPLLRSHGIRTWYSTHDIKTGEDWEKEIREGLRRCDWFLVVLTPDAVASDWVRAEVHWATDNRKGQIIPLLLASCSVEDLHLKLNQIHRVDFQADRKGAAQGLLSTLDTLPEAPRTTPPESQEWGSPVEAPQVDEGPFPSGAGDADSETAPPEAPAPIPALLSSDELNAFGVAFRGHRVEMWFGANTGGGVPLESIECLREVKDIEPVAGMLATARDLYVRAREEEARRKGHAFDNNLLLGAASWCPARADISGGRRRFARLGFRRVCFYDHVFLGEGLNRNISEWLAGWLLEGGDKDLVKDVRGFLRSNPRFIPAEKLHICTDDLELAHAPNWPMIPFRVGLAVVIITSDSRVVVPLRSSHAALGHTPASVRTGRYSSSVGEGMARDDTVRGLHLLREKRAGERRRMGPARCQGQDEARELADDTPSLVALAARALLDEMGIEDQVDCNVGKEVLCVSLNLDRHEAFPHITTVLKTRHTFDQIDMLRRKKARDGHWEHNRVLGLSWDKTTAKGLANGVIEVGKVGRIVAASVREQIFFAQAAEALGLDE
jgi:hypothetical protein